MRRRVWQILRLALLAAVAVPILGLVLILSLRLPVVQRHLGELITAAARKPGAFFVRVGNVRGDLPWQVRVDRVEIGDALGVWLTIEDAEAWWHPFDLWHPFDHTHLRINVDRVHARRLVWTRLPEPDELDEEPFRWDEFPRIVARDLVVDELELGGALLGGAHAVFEARGNGVLGEWDHGRLDLSLDRTDGRRGRIRIDLASGGVPPRFSGSVEANEDDGGALASLARLGQTGPLHVRVDCDGPLAAWRANARVEAGAIGNLQVGAQVAFGESGAFRLDGTFDPVAEQRARYLVGRGAPLRLAVAGVWRPERLLRLDEARVDADGQVLDVRGSLDLADAREPFAVTASLSRPAGDTPALKLGPVALGAARLQGSGTLASGGGAASPAFSAEFEVDDLATAGAALTALRGSLRGGQNVQEGPLAFELDARGEDVTAAGQTVALLGKAPSLHVRGEAMLDAGVVAIESVELDGDALHVGGSVDVGDEWSAVTAKLDANSRDLEDLSRWLGTGVRGAAHASLELGFAVGAQRFQTKLDAEAFDLVLEDPALQALFGSQLTVKAEATGAVHGAAEASASAAAEGVRLQADAALQEDGRTISGTFSAALDNLTRLAGGEGIWRAGSVELDGQLGGVLDDFTVKTEVRASELAYRGVRLDGLQAAVAASGLPARPEVSLDAGATRGDLRARLRAGATMPDASSIEIHDAVLDGPTTSVKASARVDLKDGSLAASVEAGCDDLSRWRDVFGYELAGRLDADVAVTPPSLQQQPKGGLGLLRGSVSLRGARLVLANGEGVAVESLEATADGLALGGVPAGSARANLSAANWSGVIVEKTALSIAGEDERWRISATANGSAVVPWSLALRATLAPDGSGVTAEVEAVDATLGDDRMRLQAPTTVAWTSESLSVEPATIAVDERGTVRAEGRLGPTGVGADVKIDALPLSLVSAFVPDLVLRGSVAGSASVRGPSPARSVTQIHLEGHGIATRAMLENGVTALDAAADARYEGGRVRGHASLGGVGRERFDLTVDAPVGSGAADSAPVSGALAWSGELADLAVLAPIGEDVLRGHVEADLGLSGTVAAPVLAGSVDVRDGSYENVVSGLVLRDLELRVAARGSSLFLEKLQATDGEHGRVTGRGRFDFGRLPAFEADLDLHADSATLVRLDLVTARADADVSASVRRLPGADSSEGVVAGKVAIEEARIHIPDRFTESIPELPVIETNLPGRAAGKAETAGSPLAGPIALDVAVTSDNRTYVEGRGLESEWRTDLHVGGTVDQPKVSGAVKSVRGKLSLLGKRFDLTEGTLRFDGSAANIPYVKVSAKADANDITAIVDVTGPATKPDIELRSEPALPQDEVLARVLFGKGAAGLTPMQSVQAAQSLAELSGSRFGAGRGLIENLGRSIGLDQLAVEAGSSGGGSTLTASKYLTDKVYLRAQQGLTPEDSKASVEWEVFKGLRIVSDISQDAQGEVGAIWHWDY